MKRLTYNATLIAVAIAAAVTWSILHIVPDVCWPEYRMLLVIAIGSTLAMLVNFSAAGLVTFKRRRAKIGWIVAAFILNFAVAGAVVRLSIEALLAINENINSKPSLYCFSNLSSSYLNSHTQIFWSLVVCGFAIFLVKFVMESKATERGVH